MFLLFKPPPDPDPLVGQRCGSGDPDPNPHQKYHGSLNTAGEWSRYLSTSSVLEEWGTERSRLERVEDTAQLLWEVEPLEEAGDGAVARRSETRQPTF
jgi:hypothetical protein